MLSVLGSQKQETIRRGTQNLDTPHVFCVSWVQLGGGNFFLGHVSTDLVVYYESIKRELKTRPIYECRCDERLKTKPEESTRLTWTGFLGELENLKIETRLIDEMFESVMGEYVFLK